MIDRPHETITSLELTKLYPVTLRQLQWLDETSVITPIRSGKMRFYRRDEVLAVVLREECITVGCSPNFMNQHIEKAARHFIHHPRERYMLICRKEFVFLQYASQIANSLENLCRKHRSSCSFLDLNRVSLKVDEIMHAAPRLNLYIERAA